MRSLGVLVLGLIGLCSLPPALSAAVPAVELVADAPMLQPTSTLEFRFARPIVTREEVGVPGAKIPFQLSPAISGSFTWLSRSSGVFVPEGPWPMAGKFIVTVSKDLKTAEGKPLGGELRVELTTPGFQQTGDHGFGNGDAAEPRPELGLAYNLPVELKGAPQLIRFVNSDGRAANAEVRHATTRDYFPLQPEEEDWQSRWEKSRNPASNGIEDDRISDAPPVPKTNRLIITPAEPLQPGGIWSLEVKPGLRSQDGKHQERSGTNVALGAVTPFEIKTMEPASYVNSGRSLVLTFTQSLAPDITAETARKFLRVEPPVENFRVEESFNTLTLRGDFERGQEYTLHLEPTLVSADGLALAGPLQRPFRFAPVSPRLYLPEFTGHQVRGGVRKFEVASVNLKALKVTLRRIPAEQVPRTIGAFEKYDKDEHDEAEPYQAIPPKLIPGEVIHERRIELPQPVLDARQQTTLDWDSLLGAGVGGPIFLTVAGEPLPEAGGKAVAAQAFIQLTDLGILWKQTDEGVRVSAFSMSNGESLAKAQVTILATNYLVVARGVTGEMGMTTLPLSNSPGWLLVTKGNDVHAMRLGYEGTELPMAAFRLPTSYRGWEPRTTDKADVRGLIFTDRPLYRPGETVRVKGILRVLGKEGLTAGEGFQGTLTLQDPRGEDAGTFEVQTDARGTFDSEVVLPSSPHVRYGLRLSIGETEDSAPSGFYESFQVADYQPNAFNVDLELPSRLGVGQGVDAKLRASYYFGSPVRDAKARWTLRYARDRFAPEGFSDWRFGIEEEGTPAVLTLQGGGDLTKPEGLTIQPQLPEAKGSPFRGVLTAEVTDINQQTVTETREFRRDASSFYLGVTVPDGIVNRAGQELTYAVAAVGADGTPLPQPVEVKAELIRVHHNTVRVQGAGKAISFRTEKREEPVAQAMTKTTPLEERGGRWEALQWNKTGFKPAQAGQYRLRVTAKDAGRRTAESDFHLYVTGADQLAWDYRNPAQVDMVPDKKEYQPGETARVLLKTPISGDALVTIERGGQILRTIRTRLEGNAPALEIPLTAADAPNVFVSVMLIRGLEQSTRKVKVPEYRYGAAMLQVRDSKAFLQVAIRPTREHVEPGNPVETDVLVTDGFDRPVADAEVTFFAVDDGVLALTGYERPMLQPIFHAAVPLAIRTGLSLHKLLPEDPAALVFANKGYLIGGGGLEGPGMKLRRDFPGTAAWFPSLRTDAQGKVRVTFRAPDALTRYRLVAVAHAAAHLFGSGESAIPIRKSLMVLPALGQFANVGDQLIARAVIRNESGADGVADVSLQLDDSAVSANGVTTSRVELRNGEASAVDLPLRLHRTGSAEWKWSARMKLPNRELDDHVISQLVIRSPAPVLRETYLTELSAASTNLLEGVNPQLLEGSGVVATTVSNTRLSSLRESVNQLWDYPDGCAEQTTSALIPWALYTQLKPILPEVVKTDAEVAGAIQAGLERVFAQQLVNGGVTMWPGGNEGSTFLTAYTAIACSILQAQEIALPAGHEKLLEFLSAGLRGLAKVRDEPLLGDQALAVYALAVSGKAEPAYHEALFARRAELSRESRALLASAIIEAKGPAKMVAQLLDPKVPAPEAVSWFGGPARERAIQLLAWSRFKPKDPEVAKLVKELLEYRKSGHFGTTQGNAWALLALTKYYTAVERGGPPVVSGNIVGPGGPTPFRVTRREPAAGVTLAFSPDVPLEVLSARNPAKSTLFGETRFLVQPPLTRQPRQDRGFAVSRAYQKLADDGSIAPAADLKVALDRVLVTLRVEATRPAHFVAIDDPLPAVLEAVNPAFRSRGVAGAEDQVGWAADHREMRADRVLDFCDHLPAGAFTFRYLARVRSAGTVTAGATKVEEMYRPERFGLGESIELAALPADVK